MDHGEKFLRIVEDAKTRIAEVSAAEVKRKLEAGERFRLVDVREDGEWAAERISGAMHLGRGILERDAEKAFPDADSEIVLYCGGGFRSALSADNLQRMGFSRVYSMAGGFRAWKDAGYPTQV
jgi:rhodanese-related sulfurtransferase